MAESPRSRPALLRRAEVRVLEIREETHDTRTFRFGAPPAGLPDFAAGQFVALEIPGRDGNWIRRSYSIASSPLERCHFDLTVKRVEGGAGTGALFDGVKVGDVLRASGPFGEFTLEPSKPAIFAAGGVGVTPIMSMLRALDAQGDPPRVLLLYSNRERRDVAFEAELRAMEARRPNFEFHFALTRDPGGFPGPRGHRGRFAPEFLLRAFETRRDHVAYLCGPMPFMETIGKLLLAAGFPPTSIRTEAFIGTSPDFGGRAERS